LLTWKKNEFNEVVCHKARWVVFGNRQEHMLHYFKNYLSVARDKSLKMMLLPAVNHNLTVFQFDVATAFLYQDIEASIYVSQVLGFEDLHPAKKGVGLEVAKITLVQHQTGSTHVESPSSQNPCFSWI
jgi:hypothetical protein